MAPRGVTQKLARDSTAAYVASQPLFDALRIGMDRVGEQKANLSIARDIVQQLHVKLPDQTSKADVDRHERYMDCAVKAWRSATEIYADIFDALADVTAAEPHQGKEERHRHAEFAKMAQTVADAKRAAYSFKLYESIAKAGLANDVDGQEADNQASDNGTASNSESNESAASNARNGYITEEPVENTPTSSNTLQLLGKRSRSYQHTEEQPIQESQRTTKDLEHEGRETVAKKPKVNHGPLGGMDSMASTNRKARKRPEKKRDSGASKSTHGPPNSSMHVYQRGEPHPPPAKSQQTVPTVKYEDVSAEVEARLKAKEVKKEAKKKEQKRKRESGDSFSVGEPEPLRKDEKPTSKKAKAANGEMEVVVKKEKRKKHDRDAEEIVEDDGGKKRKKLKVG